MATTIGVVQFPGSNCELDVIEAVEALGATAEILWHDDADLRGVDAVVIPGGFAHGDYLRPGAIARFSPVMGSVATFAADGGPVVGICNGFQVLTRTGLLPGALGHNESGHFQCEWVRLEAATGKCIWTRDLAPVECPIAHGEGRYVHPDVATLAANGQVALRYQVADGYGNPNGSLADIAGVCDETGVVLGLMPHPENHVVARQHPRHGRGTATGLGLALFQQGVRYAEAMG